MIKNIMVLILSILLSVSHLQVLATTVKRAVSSEVTNTQPREFSRDDIFLFAQLADFVYMDEFKLDEAKGIEKTLKESKTIFSETALNFKGSNLDGNDTARLLFDSAIVDAEKNNNSAKNDYDKKEKFLESNNLKRIKIPKEISKKYYVSSLTEGYIAELYENTVTGTTYLIFRGSDDSMDAALERMDRIDTNIYRSGKLDSHLKYVESVTEWTLKKHKTIVIGHALGGGMAQYAGYHYNLDTVAFNSTPLPVNYLKSAKLQAGKFNPAKVHLYSAAEYLPNKNSIEPAQLFFDPVSLGAKKFLDMKDYQHITTPICISTSPEPFYTPEEDELLAKGIVNDFTEGLSRDSISKRLMDGLKGMEKNKNNSEGYKFFRKLTIPTKDPKQNKINLEVVRILLKKFNDTKDGFKRTHNTLSTGYDAVTDPGKALWRAAKGLGTMSVRLHKSRVMQAHNMNRFSRGLESALKHGADVNLCKTEINIKYTDIDNSAAVNFNPNQRIDIEGPKDPGEPSPPENIKPPSNPPSDKSIVPESSSTGNPPDNAVPVSKLSPKSEVPVISDRKPEELDNEKKPPVVPPGSSKLLPLQCKIIANEVRQKLADTSNWGEAMPFMEAQLKKNKLCTRYDEMLLLQDIASELHRYDAEKNTGNTKRSLDMLILKYGSQGELIHYVDKINDIYDQENNCAASGHSWDSATFVCR